MTDDRLTSDELFAIFKGLIPTPVAFYLMNGGAKLDRGALEMVQAVREQATTDRIEAQAAEIERLRSMVLEGAAKNAAEIVRLELEIERLQKEVERRAYDGIHTCHDDCQRVACRQRRQIEQLREALKDMVAYSWFDEQWQDQNPEYVDRARAALGDTK